MSNSTDIAFLAGRAICQECLADLECPVPDEKGIKHCPLCRGVACSCDRCLGTLADLHAGDREARVLMSLPDGFHWTPERGVNPPPPRGFFLNHQTLVDVARNAAGIAKSRGSDLGRGIRKILGK